MKPAASSTTTRDVPLLDALKAVADLAYEGFEVWAEHLWEQDIDPARLGAEAAARGLALTLHGPTRDLNVTSSNAGIRAESQRQYLEALDVAVRLGAQVVVLHPGAMSSAGDVPAPFLDLHLDFFGRVAARALTLGLRIGIENMERRRLELLTTPDAVIDLLRRVDDRALGLTFDLAHHLYNGDALEIAGWIPHIVHVHVSGSTHEKVHVPLADGAFDLPGAMRALSAHYAGLAAIESYVRGRPDALLAANRATWTAYLRRDAAGTPASEASTPASS